MRFSEFNEQEQIQYIKDSFVLLLEQLAQDPTKLKNYFKLPEKPKQIKPVIERASDGASEEQKNKIIERNKLAEEKAASENEKLNSEYLKATEGFAKAEAIIKNLKKKEGCMCGSCLDVKITNSIIPPELAPLIEAAREEAKARTY